MKVVFVGSNPSTSSPNNTPFHPSTKSRKVVDAWVWGTGLDIEPVFLNVSDIPIANNKPLKLDDSMLSIFAIKVGAHVDAPVVALGATAATALRRVGIHCLCLPHPSGMNRKLNSPEYVEHTIETLKVYIERYNTDGDG